MSRSPETEKARIKRIIDMENLLDSVAPVISRLEEALEAYADIQDDYFALVNYYSSDDWREDFEADEEGKLPHDLKRGVLSEDAVYNLITDHQNLMISMQKLTEKCDTLDAQ